MKHFSDEWINDWCCEHGWTEPSIVGYNAYWAFPPGGVMPEPIPSAALRAIKSQRGLCSQERWLVVAAMGMSVAAVAASVLLRSPMPLAIAFCCDALAAASLEVEDL